MAFGNLLIRLGLNNRQFIAGLDAARSAVRGFNRVASGAAKATSVAFRTMTGSVRGSVTLFHELNGAAQSVRGIINGLAMPVKLAADVESARVRFRVMVGDLEKADGVFAKLEKLAKDNPILDLAEMAAGAAQLVGAGMEATEIPQFLENLGNAAQDGQKFLQMVTAASQVLSKGGKVQGDELLQFAEAGLPVIGEMARILGMTGAEFSKLQESGKITFATLEQAITNLTTGTGRYAGIAAAMAQTTTGRWDAVKTSINEVMRAMGDKMIDGITPILDSAKIWIEGLMPWAQKAGAVIRDALLFIQEGFSRGLLGDLLWNSLKLAGMKFLDMLYKGITATIEKMKEGLRYAAGELKDTITLANPFTRNTEEGDKARQGIKDRAEGKGAGPSWRQHYESTPGYFELDEKLKLDDQKLENIVENSVAEIRGYANARKERLEGQRANAGRKNTDAGADSSIVQYGPFQTEEQKKAAAAKPAGKPAAGGARRGGAAAGGGRGAAGGGGDMSWINRRNEAAGRARGLVKSYRAQAKGSGHQNWQEFLSSGVRTAGLKPAQLSKLRGMDPNALAANITNRKGRAAREEERNSADATAQKSQAAADTIIRDMPGVRDGIETMKNHLSKLQTE